MRYPESEYASQGHQQKQQHQRQQYQQQQNHQQQQQNYHQQNQNQHQQHQNNQHHESSYRTQRHSDYGRSLDAVPVYRPYYDEDYGGASTFGRTAGAGVSNNGTGYRYHHESSYHRENGGGGAGGGNSSRYYAQQHYSNGYNGGNSGHYKGHLNTTTVDGGYFGKNNAYQKRPPVHHKIHCCCFSFKWPPWGYEPCEPPTPIFYNRKHFKPSILPTPHLSPRQQSKRFISSESPQLPANQHLPPLYSTPNPLHTSNTTPGGRLTPPPNLHY